MARLSEASGISSFRLNLRAAVRALWSGTWGESEFIGAVGDDIERAYPRAWLEGAKDCGIVSLDELTLLERNALRQATYDAFPFIPPFADAIVAGSKANGGKLTPLLKRTDLWVNGYNSIVAQARLMACGDRKLEWQLGATEDHCYDCSRYNGRVYRGSVWAKYNIQPQSHGLACHGWRCDCRLVQTDKPANKGRPPAMTG